MKTVLIMDQDAVQRQATSDFLEAHGWQVLQAGPEDALLDLAQAKRPEIIVCDLSGSHPAGLSICRSLRSDATLGRTPVVGISRQGCECDRMAALEAGVSECLSQPYDPQELLEVLNRLSAVLPGTDRPGRVLEVTTWLRFWGVRGSTPTPGPATVRYGGNTSCVEVRCGKEIIILDAGTGLRLLGRALMAEFADRNLDLTLLLTHTHWDHIHGLPYFMPIYKPNNRIRILGYEGARQGLASVLSAQMESPYFPIGFDALPGSVIVEELKEMEFALGPVRVQAYFANHPGTCVGYRLTTPHGSMAFFPDNEIGCHHQGTLHKSGRKAPHSPTSAREYAEGLAEFLHGVDVLIIDSQYTAPEYEHHLGWGHGCLEEVICLALQAQAAQLFLFHHDPDHDDGQISRMVDEARHLVSAKGGRLRVEAAREGLTVKLPLSQPALNDPRQPPQSPGNCP